MAVSVRRPHASSVASGYLRTPHVFGSLQTRRHHSEGTIHFTGCHAITRSPRSWAHSRRSQCRRAAAPPCSLTHLTVMQDDRPLGFAYYSALLLNSHRTLVFLLLSRICATNLDHQMLDILPHCAQLRSMVLVSNSFLPLDVVAACPCLNSLTVDTLKTTLDSAVVLKDVRELSCFDPEYWDGDGDGTDYMRMRWEELEPLVPRLPMLRLLRIRTRPLGDSLPNTYLALQDMCRAQRIELTRLGRTEPRFDRF
ncbi:hypothetical protein EXIGLDRAFT_404166 [Exidia glandulosa HHB12029]|uniref:F-box domain-containing protein n=1 Tax=Exidia glandulosa HHB12029 TaxID=1314781 RepID=A0A165KS68_EXIGL|nr:hypothetical protein EXIGLDRAFT_404166 [Exidia glandulosa HHB12029]